MHPSRLVAACFLVVGLLDLLYVGVVAGGASTALATLLLGAGVVLVLASVYGLLRYEENPVVTEYGPVAYLLVGGASVQAFGLAAVLLATVR